MTIVRANNGHEKHLPMTAALLAERRFVPCWCGAARKRAAGPWVCGRKGCDDLGLGGAKVAQTAGSERGATRLHSAPSKPRAGKAAEDALADQLARSGFIVLTWGEWLMWAMHGLALDPTVAVREARWGQALVPERRFRSDFMLPASRLFVEIEGGAHGVQRQRKSDILRAQIAEQAGYRILRVLPEQVADGSALALVRRAEGGTK